MSAVSTDRRREVHTLLDRFAVLAMLMSLASGLIGANVLLRSDLLRGSALDGPRPMETSFGTLTVNGADILDGLTAQDLGGMTHGISGLVLSDKAQAVVSVTLRNTSDSALPYGPELFRLREGEYGQPIAPMGSAPGEGVVPAGTSIDLLFDFVVTHLGAALYFEFQDPGSDQLAVVRVGSTELSSPEDVEGGHGH